MASSGLLVDSFSEQPSRISFNLFQKDNSYHRQDGNLVRHWHMKPRVDKAQLLTHPASEGESSSGRAVLSFMFQLNITRYNTS